MKTIISLKNRIFGYLSRGKRIYKTVATFTLCTGLLMVVATSPVSADLVSRATQSKDNFLQTAQAIVVVGAIVTIVIGGLCQLGGKAISAIGKGLMGGAVLAIIIVFAAPDLVESIPH